MYLMRERRVDGISKVFGLGKWKDGVATNKNGGWVGRGQGMELTFGQTTFEILIRYSSRTIGY